MKGAPFLLGLYVLDNLLKKAFLLFWLFWETALLYFLPMFEFQNSQKSKQLHCMCFQFLDLIQLHRIKIKQQTLTYSLALVCSIPSWLARAESMCMVHVVLPKQPSFAKQTTGFKSFCSNLSTYTVYNCLFNNIISLTLAIWTEQHASYYTWFLPRPDKKELNEPKLNSN